VKVCTEFGKKYRERDAKKKREKRSRQGHRKQNARMISNLPRFSPTWEKLEDS
jgi:hypothetical protein